MSEIFISPGGVVEKTGTENGRIDRSPRTGWISGTIVGGIAAV